VDATGEAWIFHISADPTHTSAYWAAQRVPEGHMAVIANSYILREIDTTDAEHFMWSADLLTSTVQHGLWDGHGVFSWAAVLGDYDDRPWYASVRLYSVYNRVAKSLGIQVNTPPPLAHPLCSPHLLFTPLCARRHGSRISHTRSLAHFGRRFDPRRRSPAGKGKPNQPASTPDCMSNSLSS